MIESVNACIDDPDTPFLTLFLIFFGETLACFLGVLVTAFFGFHVWLMMRAMTTIEFCEKSTKGGKKECGTSAYDNGPCGNIKTVLGEQPLLWLLPLAPGAGDGLTFVGEDSRRYLRGGVCWRGQRPPRLWPHCVRPSPISL